jgi:thioredoxin reductase (NADPH)
MEPTMATLPVILAVDDDRTVLAAVSRDLRAHYNNRFRILRADSGESALETLRQLKLRNTPVALILTDQRMPEMTGVELLAEAAELYPDARRVLLTAYADTNVAIRAINDVRIDHYLLKPWDPPEEQLYPVLDDLLDDWLAGFIPPFEGARIVGHRWSRESFQLRDFLARNLVPYRWLDVETNPEAGELLAQAQVGSDRLPVVVLADGAVLVQPSQREVAERIGLETAPTLPFYDLIIVGAGPAGMAGAVYGASEGLRTLLIERQAPGGQAGMSSRIENYLGFPAGLSGADLARRAVAQAKRLGTEILSAEVTGLRTDGPYRIVQLADGSEISAHVVLITTGVAYRTLDAPGIERLQGVGVYYGGALSEAIATCGEDVFIVGGANSAGQAAMHFARYARQVTMLVRGDSLARSGMSQYLVERIDETPNIHVWFNSQVVEAVGEKRLETLRIEQRDSGETCLVPADDLFIFIGAQPSAGWLDGQVARDPAGYILTGAELEGGENGSRWTLPRRPLLLETSMPGVFAAGDIRHRSVKRIASATGEGSMAIQLVHQYLNSL